MTGLELQTLRWVWASEGLSVLFRRRSTFAGRGQRTTILKSSCLLLPLPVLLVGLDSCLVLDAPCLTPSSSAPSKTMSARDYGRCVRRKFVGAGCNRIVNNLSWGACGLLAFGAQNGVAIFCPDRAQILTTLPGHKAVVNCTHWLPSNKFAFRAKHFDRHYLLSGDAEGVIMLWELSLLDQKWKHVLQVPESHKKGVTCITAVMVSDTNFLFATTSSDNTVHVYEVLAPTSIIGEYTVSFVDSISVGSKTMVAISLAELPGNSSQLVLAMGGLDNKVHLYCGDRTGKFIHACDLKGHTDWIRSLDFSLPLSTDDEAKSIFLVSSSQDRGIRIWKIAQQDSLANQDSRVGEQEIDLASYIKGPLFVAGSCSYQVSLESLLIGHEDWVYSVEWQPPSISSLNEDSYFQPMSILSASMDKTMMIWKPERTTDLWMNMVTVGELSHCALGFYGGHWSPTGNSIIAYGYGGSFHLWKNVGADSDNWQPQRVPSGHFAAVTDIAWARSGKYILSVSHDQTARVFAPWKTEGTVSDEDPWHEIARPQVHGHDINCVTIIKGTGNSRFVSGAEEKVSRVFEAPLSFLRTLDHATSEISAFAEDGQTDVQVLGANMSALGLSQKPIYIQSTKNHESANRNGGDGMDTLETIPDANPAILTEAPIEEQLAWHTLWPESHKLYGHGNELFSLCSDHEGKLVASSCKGQSAAVAEIWLWQVGSWKAVGRLHSHTLTVTQMEFSHDNKMLLAVSRDRQLSVFSIKTTAAGEIDYQLIARQEGHKRIIWSCSWNPFGHEFATGSRDKTVKIWGVEKESSVKLISTLPQFKSSVTALSWLGVDEERNTGILAVGMESGLIELWNITITKGIEFGCEVSVGLHVRVDALMCHVSTVNRLAWREVEKRPDRRCVELASCGADHSVRIFEVDVVESL